LAKERTFAALIRTSLSFIGFGIAIVKLLPDLEPPWVGKTVGIALILGGVLTAAAGFRMVHQIVGKLREEGIKEQRWLLTAAALLLVVTAVLGLVVVGLD
jgi:uncharacterized membrane protein YidH (DUF202 family)